MDDLGADSLDTVELVMALEDAFEVKFSRRGRKITVKEAIEYIETNGSKLCCIYLSFIY